MGNQPVVPAERSCWDLVDDRRDTAQHVEGCSKLARLLLGHVVSGVVFFCLRRGRGYYQRRLRQRSSRERAKVARVNECALATPAMFVAPTDLI